MRIIIGFHKRRLQFNSAWINPADVKDLLDIQIVTVHGAEHIIGRMIVQLFSCDGIDVGKQEVKEALIKVVKSSSFWKDTADMRMRVFARSFLIRTPRLSIEYFDPIFFDFPWI